MLLLRGAILVLGDAPEDAIRRTIPVGRYGRSEEVASMITFLCSEAASYVNGTAIDVDGGRGVHV